MPPGTDMANDHLRHTVAQEHHEDQQDQHGGNTLPGVHQALDQSGHSQPPSTALLTPMMVEMMVDRMVQAIHRITEVRAP